MGRKIVNPAAAAALERAFDAGSEGLGRAKCVGDLAESGIWGCDLQGKLPRLDLNQQPCD